MQAKFYRVVGEWKQETKDYLYDGRLIRLHVAKYKLILKKVLDYKKKEKPKSRLWGSSLKDISFSKTQIVDLC